MTQHNSCGVRFGWILEMPQVGFVWGLLKLKKLDGLKYYTQLCKNCNN